MKDRIAIVGNAGSGKTYLAKAMSRALRLPIIDLDELFWMPGSYSEQRPKDVVRDVIEEKKGGGSWIVEGVYGELVDLFLDRTEMLVWIDLEWDVCRESLIGRGSETAKRLGLQSEQATEKLEELLNYAEQYWVRTNSRSHQAHQEMLDSFNGLKFRFRTRSEVCSFIGSLAEQNAARAGRARDRGNE